MSSRKRKCVWHIHGDKGVGKTTLVDNFPYESSSETIEEGIRAVRKNFVMDNGLSLELLIYEISESCKFEFLSKEGTSLEENIKKFFSSATCSLFMFDLTDLDSYLKRIEWRKIYHQNDSAVLLFLIGNKADLQTENQVGDIFGMDNIMYFETSANDNSKAKDLFIMLSEITVAKLQELRMTSRFGGYKEGDDSSSDDDDYEFEEEDEEEGEGEEYIEPNVKVEEFVSGFKDNYHLLRKLELLGRKGKYRRRIEVLNTFPTFKIVLKNKTVKLLKPFLLKSPLYKEHFSDKDEYLGLSDIELNIDPVKANRLLVFYEEKDIDKLGIRMSDYCHYFILFHALQLYTKCYILADNIYSINDRFAFKHFFDIVTKYENEQIQNLFLQTNVKKIDEMMRTQRIRRYNFKTSYAHMLLEAMDCSGFETLQKVLRKRVRIKPELGEKYKYLDSLVYHLNVHDENDDDRELREHQDYSNLPNDTYNDFDYEKIQGEFYKLLLEGEASDLIVYPNDYYRTKKENQGIFNVSVNNNNKEEKKEKLFCDVDHHQFEDEEEEEEYLMKNKKFSKPMTFKVHKSILGFKSEYFFQLFKKDPNLKTITVKELNSKCLYVYFAYVYNQEDVFDDDEEEFIHMKMSELFLLLKFGLKYRDYKFVYDLIDIINMKIFDCRKDIDVMILYRYGETILGDPDFVLKYMLPLLTSRSMRMNKKSVEWVLRKLEKGRRMKKERRLFKLTKKKFKMLKSLVDRQNIMISENEKNLNILNQKIKKLEKKDEKTK